MRKVPAVRICRRRRLLVRHRKRSRRRGPVLVALLRLLGIRYARRVPWRVVRIGRWRARVRNVRRRAAAVARGHRVHRVLWRLRGRLRVGWLDGVVWVMRIGVRRGRGGNLDGVVILLVR